MTQAPVTLQLTNGTALAQVTGWVDTNNGQHSGIPANYSVNNIVWSADDGGVLVSLTPAPTIGQNQAPTDKSYCKLTFLGPAGSFNLTATLTANGLPTLTSVVPVTLQGPQPAGLTVTLA